MRIFGKRMFKEGWDLGYYMNVLIVGGGVVVLVRILSYRPLRAQAEDNLDNKR